MVLYAYVLCFRILPSSRITRYDPGRRTPHFGGASDTLLESAQDRILGVDTPGQLVLPCVRYGTTC
jgi:hypothetical protein